MEAAGYFSDIFSAQGFKFVRIGGPERQKKMLHGDIVLDLRTDDKKKCFVYPYFIEVKKRAKMDAFTVLEEAEQHAEETGKWGSILYLIRQSSGSKRDGVMIAMTPHTFRKVAQHLQGYINDDPN